jgi:hypothetical protein
MWNIEGLSNEKIQDLLFQKQLSHFHIASLVETWTGEINQGTGNIFPNHYLVYSSFRKKHKKARRYSGGIHIYAKKQL